MSASRADEALRVGLDFGLSNLDAALLEGERLIRAWRLPTTGPASSARVHEALAAGGVRADSLMAIATTGGRHRDLPAQLEGVALVPVGEARAIGRGGLALAGLVVGFVPATARGKRSI